MAPYSSPSVWEIETGVKHHFQCSSPCVCISWYCPSFKLQKSLSIKNKFWEKRHKRMGLVIHLVCSLGLTDQLAENHIYVWSGRCIVHNWIGNFPKFHFFTCIISLRSFENPAVAGPVSATAYFPKDSRQPNTSNLLLQASRYYLRNCISLIGA